MARSARIARPRAWLVAWVLSLALLLACGAARGDTVFAVADVPIDAEAESAAAARDLAIAAGQRAALDILLRRLTVAGTALPMPDADSLRTMVAGFAIDRELVSATRYRASLTVDFDPPAVRHLLRDGGIAYAETVSKPVLIVAVQRDPGGALLWEDDNRWRQAWEERPAHGGLVPLLLPLGDVIDLGTVDAEGALASDAEALAALAGLYGTGEVAVAVAGVSGSAVAAKPTAPAASDDMNADGETAAAGLPLTLSLRRIAAADGRAVEWTLIGRWGESRRTLFERGIDRVIALLEDTWKAANLIHYEQERVLTATVPIASLGAWVSIQHRLASLAIVASVSIDSLSRREARLTIDYHGTADQLRLALDQADLVLAPAADGWALSPRASGSEPGADG